MTVNIDGVRCIVIERREHYTKVATPFGEVLDVRNTEIKED